VVVAEPERDHGNLALLNAVQGFVLTAGDRAVQDVRFPAEEFEQILREATAR
jgi:hypothetical protein